MPEQRRPAPKFSWFVPIDGDGEHIGTLRAERPPTFGYLREVVETAEECGYYSLLIPTRFTNGLFEESAPLAETWTTATALAAVTTRIKFLIAVRPGFVNPGLFAQMASALSNISNGRIDLNIVPGGIQGDFERLGVDISHDERYAVAEEFIEALRRLWAEPEKITHITDHVHLEDALVSPGPAATHPAFYLGGASDNALGLAGRQADVLLAWIQPLDSISTLIERATEHFKDAGREPAFGLRTHLIVRDTESDAWSAAEELLSEAAGAVLEQRRSVFAGTAMVGQRAQTAGYEDHRMGERLWNGISTVRVNCGTAIVGTPDQVAEELLAYRALGIDEFILSGYPHVEEARRVAEDVLPLVRSGAIGE
ncbi:MAG: LLM class flavin-dependent oxidoreductase [Chloroflexi bacterium]|nr:LLM class flavin-dependent oxidoreductase [Chloroflexota bacterium]